MYISLILTGLSVPSIAVFRVSGHVEHPGRQKMTSLRTNGYPGVEREMAISLHPSVLKSMYLVQATPQDPGSSRRPPNSQC